MNTIYFNPYKHEWICEFDSSDIKRREYLLIILESRGMKILSFTRRHIRVDVYPHIFHYDKRVNSTDISGYSKSYNKKNMVILSYYFLVYYFSPKYLF